MNLQGEQAPSKRQKIMTNFENSSTETVAEQYMSWRTPLGTYGVCQEMLTENLKMRGIACPHVPNHRVVTSNNMAVVPHLPYLPELAPCDFALFPKLKMKLTGRRFETVSDIQS
jgi:hypothetical protein